MHIKLLQMTKNPSLDNAFQHCIFIDECNHYFKLNIKDGIFEDFRVVLVQSKI